MRRTIDFLLHDWLGLATLLERPRFADHSLETFASVLDTCERIARDKFAPFNRLADIQEPRFDGERVHLPEATHAALAAYAECGMLAAAQDHDVGGLQLPCVVEMAANAFFSKASVALSAYGMLTSANAGLLMAHGTPRQREVFARAEFAGRWSGTMCLSEPQAGSSLSDVATRALPDGEDQRPTRWARASGCAATRCGSPAASTISPRTSSTWCWPRSPARRADGAGHPGALAVHRAQATGG